jgi:hypothetical protein
MRKLRLLVRKKYIILYCMYARIVSHFVIFHDLVVVTVLKML